MSGHSKGGTGRVSLREECRRLREMCKRYISWLNISSPEKVLESDLRDPRMWSPIESRQYKGARKIYSDEDIRSLLRRYKTDHAVGRVLGISKQAVHQHRKKFGIPAVHDRSKIIQRDEKIRSLYEDGVSVREICKRFKLSKSSVYRITGSCKKQRRFFRSDDPGFQKRVVRDYKRGYSLDRLMREHGIYPATIYRILHLCGVQRRVHHRGRSSLRSTHSRRR